MWLDLYLLRQSQAYESVFQVVAFSLSQDYYAIQEIQSDKNVFRLIVGYVVKEQFHTMLATVARNITHHGYAFSQVTVPHHLWP